MSSKPGANAEIRSMNWRATSSRRASQPPSTSYGAYWPKTLSSW